MSSAPRSLPAGEAPEAPATQERRERRLSPGKPGKRELEAVRQVLDQAEAPKLEAFACGDKRVLEILNELPPTHELRLGLRCTLEHVGADGVARLIYREWGDELPTYETVGGMVAEGALPPGKFRVVLRRGRRTLPVIHFHVAPPLAPAARASDRAGDAGGLREAFGILRDLGVAGGSAERAELLRLVERMKELEADAESLAERVEALEGEAQTLRAIMAEAQSRLTSDDGGSSLIQLFRELGQLGQALRGQQPAAAESGGGSLEQ